MQATTSRPVSTVEASPSPAPGPGLAGSLPADKIADILGMIDGIALRTRALAHAAAEAAHAGEQGRGFSLMATEARSLAQRSADAVREIKGLMGDSAHQAGMAAEARRREFEERARRWQRSLSV
jgi:methyl-accepting chemotaxis protein